MTKESLASLKASLGKRGIKIITFDDCPDNFEEWEKLLKSVYPNVEGIVCSYSKIDFVNLQVNYLKCTSNNLTTLDIPGLKFLRCEKKSDNIIELTKCCISKLL